MPQGYLILAHDQEAQLGALTDALLTPESDDIAIIHADRRSALWQRLRTRTAPPNPRIHILPNPVTVRWGHHSIVTATERLIATALQEGCDFAHLLSGADWPIVPRATVVEALGKAAKPPCLIEAAPDPALEERMQTHRLDARWLRLDPAKDRMAYTATWELRRLSGWLDRVCPSRPRPWGAWRKGSQWWTLPLDALTLLGAELPRLRRSGRLSGTICADEHVIQTLIAAHFPERLAPARRFIDWEAGHSSPRTLTRASIPALAASGAWFARKFDARVDPFFLEPGAFDPIHAVARASD